MIRTPAFHQKIINAIPKLHGYSYRYHLDECCRQDLVQDTVCKALESTTFVPKTNCHINSWLFMIMRNVFIDKYNHKKRTLIANTAIIARTKLTEDPTIYSDLGLNELQRMIDSLDAKPRIILEYIIMGMKYDQVAKVLNINIGTVKSSIHNSRIKLHEKYKKLYK